MSLIYLTTLIITMMVLSSLSKTTPLSATSLPSYIWCISLPSLSLWVGWLSLAFIFDQLYLQIKGKLLHISDSVLNLDLFLVSGVALTLLIVLYIFLFLLSKISLTARTFEHHYQSPYQVFSSFNPDLRCCTLHFLFQKMYPNPRNLTYNSSCLKLPPVYTSVSQNKIIFGKR